MKTEEIIKAAQAYYPSGILHEEVKVSAFVRGAKWADKTMLDRACEWLKSNLDYVEDCLGDLMVCSFEHETVEEFIAAFRQAMEGGAE